MLRRVPFVSLGVVGVLVSVGAGGCSVSRFAAPHHGFTPLFDHEGQFDVAASAGEMEQIGVNLSGRVAYSPIRHLTILGGYDGDITRDASNPTAHHAGMLGLGTYVRHRVLRLEVLAVAGVGYGWGDAYEAGFSSPAEAYSLEGVYVQAGGQVAVGFEIPYFELAGGVRFMAQDGDLTYASMGFGTSGSTTGTLNHTAFVFDPFLTLRVPIDVVRFEVTVGQGVVIADPDVFLSETPSRLHITGGIAFQFDTVPVDLDETSDEAEDAPDVAPAPAQSAPPAAAPVPAPPSSYVAPT